MANTLQTWVLLVCAFLASLGCSSKVAYDASQCYVIESSVSHDAEVAKLLDAFAAAEELEIDHDDPANRVYSDKEVGLATAKITYTVGMGRFGSVLALFEFQHLKTTNLSRKLSRFVEHSLAKRFRVTECRNVDGFQTPTIYK